MDNCYLWSLTIITSILNVNLFTVRGRLGSFETQIGHNQVHKPLNSPITIYNLNINIPTYCCFAGKTVLPRWARWTFNKRNCNTLKQFNFIHGFFFEFSWNRVSKESELYGRSVKTSYLKFMQILFFFGIERIDTSKRKEPLGFFMQFKSSQR